MYTHKSTHRWFVGLIVSLTAAVLLYPWPILGAETVPVHPLTAKPTLDGNGADWAKVPAVQVQLKGKLGIGAITVKCGTYKGEVFLLVSWKDPTEDTQHKPFVWDKTQGKYVAGPQREDRLALQFAMTGQYTANWFSGNSFTADMWHWKAARSNPSGLAHDKMTIVSTTPMKKAFETKAENGKTIYIRRPGDTGDKLYKTVRYTKHQGDMVPKYVLAPNPKGSVTDVKARGVWNNGVWTVELSRKLNTGNKDDVVFRKGKTVLGGIAVFNQSGDDKHDVSDTLQFRF